jgi:hypothetical protein
MTPASIEDLRSFIARQAGVMVVVDFDGHLGETGE